MASTIDSKSGAPLDPVLAVPIEDTAFHVEQHGIDFIEESERWATARNIGAMWAGSAVNVEYFIYGALLMGFGFSFWTAVSLIIIGNLSFLLLGVASLQGQETGTTAFTISRAPFGTRGSKLMSFFNWITQLGFETEGLILIVGAAIVLCNIAGFQVNNTVKAIFVVLATAIQAIMPYFGHATMVKILRQLILPFIAIYVIFWGFSSQHSFAFAGQEWGHSWTIYTAGLAFVFALSGLGWTEVGNDYTRYLPRNTDRKSVVGWIFLGTALPEIVMMILGALGFTFLSGTAKWDPFTATAAWNSSNPFEALLHGPLPQWFVVIFMIFAIGQLFAINSLDLYSSGVSLQAMGLKLKRYQAVLLDSVIACGLTMWATFGSTFAIYMKDFVGVIIVWISPWVGIFLVDWMLRKFRYNAKELQRTDSGGLYWGSSGFNWSAIAAFFMGMVLSIMSFSKAPPPVNFPPHWATPISNHYGAVYCDGAAASNCGLQGWTGGADFSVFFGVIGAGLLYFIFVSAGGYVKRQMAKQRELEPSVYS